MSFKTIQGTVENGQIRLSEEVKLPEQATVYVIFSETQLPTRPKRVPSVRLADKSRAEFYKKIVEPDDEQEYDEVCRNL